MARLTRFLNPSLANQAATFTLVAQKQLEQPVDYFEVHFQASLTETGGAAAATDTTFFNGIAPLTITVDGNIWGTLWGDRQTDNAANQGDIGALQRWFFRENPTFQGDASVAASGTERRDIAFKVPVGLGPQWVGKNVEVKIDSTAMAFYTGGTGVPRMDTPTMNVFAHYVDNLEYEMWTNRNQITPMAASMVDTPLLVPDKPNWQYMGAVFYHVDTTPTNVDFLTYFRLRSAGGAVFRECTGTLAKAEQYARVGQPATYAATYASQPLAAANLITFETGITVVAVDPVEAKGLFWEISSNSSAAGTDNVYALHVYRKPAGVPKSAPPATAPTSSTTDSGGQRSRA